MGKFEVDMAERNKEIHEKLDKSLKKVESNIVDLMYDFDLQKEQFSERMEEVRLKCYEKVDALLQKVYQISSLQQNEGERTAKTLKYLTERVDSEAGAATAVVKKHLRPIIHNIVLIKHILCVNQVLDEQDEMDK